MKRSALFLHYRYEGDLPEMDHSESIRLMAVEKYLLGELTPELQEQFEEHFFECQECALDVRAGAALVEHSKVVLSEPVAVSQASSPRSSGCEPVRVVPACIGRACSGGAANRGCVSESGDLSPAKTISQQPANSALGFNQRKHTRSEYSPDLAPFGRRLSSAGKYPPGQPLYFIHF